MTTTIPGVSFARVTRSQWLKAGSVRSLRATAISAVGVTVAFTALIAVGLTAAETEDGLAPAEMIAQVFGAHPALATLGWSMGVAQVLVAIVGVLIVSSERATGLIAMTLSATPRRTTVIGAKLLVSAVSGAVIGAASTTASLLVATPAFAGFGYSSSLLEPDILAAIAGSAFFLAAVAVIASSIALLITPTAGAAGAALGLLVVLPSAVQLVPAVGPAVHAVLPSTLGQVLYSAVSQLGWPAYAIAAAGLLAWAAVLGLIGGAVFMRRDV